MLGRGSLLREVWEFVPILFLFLTGGLIAIRSGVERPVTTVQLRQAAGNLSKLIVRMLGYIVALATLQYWIGLHALLGW
jgi:hypothetical protein